MGLNWAVSLSAYGVLNSRRGHGDFFSMTASGRAVSGGRALKGGSSCHLVFNEESAGG